MLILDKTVGVHFMQKQILGNMWEDNFVNRRSHVSVLNILLYVLLNYDFINNVSII